MAIQCERVQKIIMIMIIIIVPNPVTCSTTMLSKRYVHVIKNVTKSRSITLKLCELIWLYNVAMTLFKNLYKTCITIIEKTFFKMLCFSYFAWLVFNF